MHPLNTLATANPDAKWDAVPHILLGDVSDDLPDTDPLLYRLIIAKRALIAGYETGGEDPRACLTDLLADIRHVCDLIAEDFASLDAQAAEHYANERVDFSAVETPAKA